MSSSKLQQTPTRELKLSNERWNQLFGLPEGTKTKRKTIKMTPYLQKMADGLDGGFVDQQGNKVSVTRRQADDLLARESRNGEIFVGLVGIDSGQLIIVDPAYLENWKHFESADPKKPFDHPDGDYEKLSELSLSTGGAFQVPKPILYGQAVSASTNGDGGMPVYATFVNGRVRSLRIEVIP